MGSVTLEHLGKSDCVWTALIALVITSGCGQKKKEQPASAPSVVAPGSGSASAAPVVPAPQSPTRFVAVHEKTARIIEVDGTSAKVISTSELPQTPMAVVWGGSDPVVLFATSESAIPGTEGDPKLEGRVGAITNSGLKLIPALPASTWTIPKPKDAENLGANWELRATSNGEIWEGRCEWGGIEDGGHCDEWVYARVGGAFPLTSRTPGPEPGGYDWTPAAPAPGYAVTFETEPDNESHSKITCKGGGVTLTLPNDDHSDAWDKDSGVKWVSTEPPMFVATQTIDGLVGWFQPVVFEGCAWSKKFDGAKLYSGPDDTLVIANATTMSIRHGGKELASLPGADVIAFAPAELDTRSAFAILERQLAGDMSMLVAGTVLITSGPIIKPGAIKSARITSYSETKLDDATSLAAEIEIAGAGLAGSLRTVQLINNASGTVIAESFAPPNPFVPPPTARQAIPETPAGPLAAFLTSPPSAAAALDGNPVVFGTDANERGIGETGAKQLLEHWGKLALTLEPSVHEVHSASAGYAVGTVNLAKRGGAPLRMPALIIGKPAADKSWKVVALHYLAP